MTLIWVTPDKADIAFRRLLLRNRQVQVPQPGSIWIVAIVMRASRLNFSRIAAYLKRVLKLKWSLPNLSCQGTAFHMYAIEIAMNAVQSNSIVV